ncbi:hypothetical protein IWQ61_006500 [Dispira simplex]|nr:hypothetical protein IWQ61_006500 [Dispira simplex]
MTRSRRSHPATVMWTCLAATAVAVTVAYTVYNYYWTNSPDDTTSESSQVKGKRPNASRDHSDTLEEWLVHYGKSVGSGSRSTALSRHPLTFESTRSGLPKLTVYLNNTLIWNPSQDPQCPNYAFKLNAIPLLHIMSEYFDVYCIAQIRSTAEQADIRQLLDPGRRSQPTTHAPSVSADNDNAPETMDPRKLLFCQTTKGKVHIVRHLQPLVHVDADLDSVVGLATFIPHMIWLARPATLPLEPSPDHSTTTTGPETPQSSDLRTVWDLANVCVFDITHHESIGPPH